MTDSNLKKISKFIALHVIHFQATWRLWFNLRFNSLTMSMSSSAVVALSQNLNRSLKTLSTLSKSIEELRQQIENEMHALSNQSLRRLDRIKERLRAKENERKLTLKYTWITWQYVIQEKIWREEYKSLKIFKKTMHYDDALKKMLKAQNILQKRQMNVLALTFVSFKLSADSRSNSNNHLESFFNNEIVCLISCCSTLWSLSDSAIICFAFSLLSVSFNPTRTSFLMR